MSRTRFELGPYHLVTLGWPNAEAASTPVPFGEHRTMMLPLCQLMLVFACHLSVDWSLSVLREESGSCAAAAALHTRDCAVRPCVHIVAWSEWPHPSDSYFVVKVATRSGTLKSTTSPEAVVRLMSGHQSLVPSCLVVRRPQQRFLCQPCLSGPSVRLHI